MTARVWREGLTTTCHAQDKEKAQDGSVAKPIGKAAGQVETFWQIVVEAGLLSSSHERKYLGLQLLRRMLPFLRYHLHEG